MPCGHPAASELEAPQYLASEMDMCNEASRKSLLIDRDIQAVLISESLSFQGTRNRKRKKKKVNQTSKVLFSPLMRKSKGFIQLEYKFSPAPEGGFEVRMGKVLRGRVLMDEVLMGKVLRGKAWENKCKPRPPFFSFNSIGAGPVSPHRLSQGQ